MQNIQLKRPVKSGNSDSGIEWCEVLETHSIWSISEA